MKKTDRQAIDKNSPMINQLQGEKLPSTPKAKPPVFPYARLLSSDPLMNPAQWRTDIWNKCREIISCIAGSTSEKETIADHLMEELKKLLTDKQLHSYESFWVFPGRSVLEELNVLLNNKDFSFLETKLRNVVSLLSVYGDHGLRMYQKLSVRHDNLDVVLEGNKKLKKHFSVLVVDDMPHQMRKKVLEELKKVERIVDDFVYDLVFVDNVEDAIIAALYNQNILACVIRQDLPLQGTDKREIFDDFMSDWAKYLDCHQDDHTGSHSCLQPRGIECAALLKDLRPSLNLYLVSDTAFKWSGEDTKVFDRIFYRYDDITEIHMTLLDGVRKKYRTPFFDSLQKFAERPVGNFHALPIARGHSVFNSPWLQDMRAFYGDNIFMAETSATTGGLDSLLDPKGTLKEAQAAAAQTFGAHHTFFSTNGTSTSNKIVVQALIKPGDIVLIDRNCHKSHHYGIVLAGGKPLYLDAFWKKEYALYGAVSLTGTTIHGIVDKLKELQQKGLLNKVKMLLLTNCTFDGIVYNPEKVMEEVLKIKPDIYFLWDEAWFAFARFFPTTRRRTAMYAAQKLQKKIGSGVELHVYSTQSTHKSLSSLRQGSMIHVFDSMFSKVKNAFHEAYYTHTSTSPNYQILASLDLSRRQADLEGFKMVSSTYQKAQTLRKCIKDDPEISKFFTVLSEEDLIPSEFRAKPFVDSGSKENINKKRGACASFDKAWQQSEFVLDPTRITLCTTQAAVGGNDFKVTELMDKFDIQVNKTSLNNVLFIITIGVTWGGMDYLLESLRKLAREYTARYEGSSANEKRYIEEKVERLKKGATHEPKFSAFHPECTTKINAGEGDMRKAFFLASDEENKEYFKLQDLLELIEENDRKYVCASFIIPYPPGFPILVPGQVITKDILCFMDELDIKEIHGYNASLGLPILKNLA